MGLGPVVIMNGPVAGPEGHIAQPPALAEGLVLRLELLAQALLLVRRQRIEPRRSLPDALPLALRQGAPGRVIGTALTLLLGVELGERSGRRVCGGRSGSRR